MSSIADWGTWYFRRRRYANLFSRAPGVLKTTLPGFVSISSELYPSTFLCRLHRNATTVMTLPFWMYTCIKYWLLLPSITFEQWVKNDFSRNPHYSCIVTSLLVIESGWNKPWMITRTTTHAAKQWTTTCARITDSRLVSPANCHSRGSWPALARLASWVFHCLGEDNCVCYRLQRLRSSSRGVIITYNVKESYQCLVLVM